MPTAAKWESPGGGERSTGQNIQWPESRWHWRGRGSYAADRTNRYRSRSESRSRGHGQITIPFGGIELVYPHDPIVKLDGGHGDPLHRLELQTFRVRIDPVRLGRYTEQLLRRVAEQGLTAGTYVIDGPPGGPVIDPLVEEPDGWIPAEPVLDVLGHRVEVRSQDAVAMLEPDLAEAIACC